MYDEETITFELVFKMVWAWLMSEGSIWLDRLAGWLRDCCSGEDAAMGSWRFGLRLEMLGQESR